VFICGTVRYIGVLVHYIKPSLINYGPVIAVLTTTVVHNYKLLINDVKPDHSLIHVNECLSLYPYKGLVSLIVGRWF